jgi:hypothetical protein
MMVVKLHYETSDALEFCSKDHLNYLQGVETSKQQKLTENEKKDLIIRSALFGEGVIFKGRSLCLNSI